jgi:hypothetical protein
VFSLESADYAESDGVPMTPVELVLLKLHNPKRNGSGYQSQCPAHEDRNPSLSISEGDDGRALLKCHAGCPIEAILKAIGLTLADLMPRRKPTGKPRIVAEYHYHDAAGIHLYDVVRFEPKAFRQRSANGAWTTQGIAKVLYRMPELLASDVSEWVFVTEGEKDADAVCSLGFTATCNPGGAEKWSVLADDSALHGRCVCIWRDKDKAGYRHAADVAKRLAGKATEIIVIESPGAAQKDAADFIAARRLEGNEDEQIRLDVEIGLTTWRVKHTEPAAIECLTESTSGPVLLNLADVEPVPLRWLWADVFALGKLSIVSGEPGVAKSMAMLKVVAIVTTGERWPDGRINTGPGGVVLMSAEDDAADTIRPRLDAAGADVSRINLLQGINTTDDEGGRRVIPVTLASIAAIEAAVEQTPNCRLVLIDPISCFIGKGVDSHVMADVRALLTPLAELAARRNVAIVAISHLRKGEGSAIHRTMGSQGFVAAARAVWGVAKDNANPLGPRRIMACIKNNLAGDGSALAYNIRLSNSGIAYVEFEPDRVTMSADEAMAAPEGKRGPKPIKRDGAVEWLRELLQHRPLPAAEVKQAAEDAGVSWRTVERAKDELNIRPRREGGLGSEGRWVWAIPDQSPPTNLAKAQ